MVYPQLYLIFLIFCVLKKTEDVNIKVFSKKQFYSRFRFDGKKYDSGKPLNITYAKTTMFRFLACFIGSVMKYMKLYNFSGMKMFP